MSLIAKLWAARRSDARDPPHPDRSSLPLGGERVRILLFRECEWRGRKLLFDSAAADRSQQCSSENNTAAACQSRLANGQLKARRDEATTTDGLACEHGKLLCEDISLLSEMIFGTVAMTYRGPSFKIHAMSSPGCLMCTKVFPFSEHSVCKRSERQSSDTLGGSSTFDSNSSSSSMRTQHSQAGSGNLSGNSLSPGMRKSSTCSSTGSGWDIDVPRLGSSQSLDGNGSCLSAGGSLSSLRRRWQRAVSTSLSRSESDEVFGQGEPPADAAELHARRHKTRLGLALLLQLPPGHERVTSNCREMNDRLLEHAALLEGMLDRLRYSCVEARGPERNLVARLYRASGCCTLSVLGLLTRSEREPSTAPLVWHELLLNSSMPVEMRVDALQRSLQHMCRLLEELDTKSTNFFLSTIVTAVLTHHLGWVHTAPSHRNKQLMENLVQQYPCNPLWAQLNDLYGSLGTPARVAHTVIAGDSCKTALVDSVLGFLSYFVRSGLVERRQETRSSTQEDVQEATAILERALRNNPALIERRPPPEKRSLGRRAKQLELPSDAAAFKSKSCEELRKGFHAEKKPNDLQTTPEKSPAYEEVSMKKMKRSGTLQKSLNELAVAESVERKEVETASKVKIVVSDEAERKEGAILRNIEKMSDEDEVDAGVEPKLAALRRQKLAEFEDLPVNSKVFEEQSMVFPATVSTDAPYPGKSPVYFTLGGDDKSKTLSIRERLRSTRKCQCSYTFTRMPSTSAELPEGVLRKIIQRNFPESSKNMPTGSEEENGICLKCRRGYSARGFDNGKLLLETPTNATELLRGCAARAAGLRANSLEALVEASCVIELPMPRSQMVPQPSKKRSSEHVGFSRSLLGTRASDSTDAPESGYAWGMVVQGLTKRKRKSRRRPEDGDTEWWWPIRKGLSVEAKFPLVDQPVAEVLCVLGDMDTWRVELLSNATATPVPVGMSRLVANMLEAFVYVWRESRSVEQCIKLIESRLREMWMRSETLAEFLMAADVEVATVGNIMSFLDIDAADLPLLLAVATTHSPQIAQRFGLTLA